MDRSLVEERPVVLQVLDRGRYLLQGVTCPALEAEVTECTNHWVKVNNDTDAKLKKSVHFLSVPKTRVKILSSKFNIFIHVSNIKHIQVVCSSLEI